MPSKKIVLPANVNFQSEKNWTQKKLVVVSKKNCTNQQILLHTLFLLDTRSIEIFHKQTSSKEFDLESKKQKVVIFKFQQQLVTKTERHFFEISLLQQQQCQKFFLQQTLKLFSDTGTNTIKEKEWHKTLLLT